MALRAAALLACAGAAAGELYCPYGAGDFKFVPLAAEGRQQGSAEVSADVNASSTGIVWEHGGWTMTGSGGVHGAQSFNLLGGYVEFDMDTSGAHGGVNNNFYTSSPDRSRFPNYCDIQDGNYPHCMEMDIIENNGNCLAQTTWHTWPNHNGDCDQGGCWGQRRLPGGSFHMRAEFSWDGWMTVYLNGQKVDISNPVPSDNSRKYIVQTMQSVGAQFHSTQWVGWVPGASSCPGGGDLGSSRFSVHNVRISGTVVQGPVPAKCSGDVGDATEASAIVV